MTRLLDWIIGREPVATVTGLAGGVTALLGLLAAFEVWRPTVEQTAAIGAFVAWVAGWIARRAVTPVTTPVQRQYARMRQRVAEDVRADRAMEELDTVADDSRIHTDDRASDETGGIAAGLMIGFAIVFLLIFAFCLSLGDGEMGDEQSWARTEDNRPCEGDNACQGRQKKGCAESSGHCEDNDDVRLFLCLPESTCEFHGEPT